MLPLHLDELIEWWSIPRFTHIESYKRQFSDLSHTENIHIQNSDKDIDLVASQSGVSREQAKAALLANNGDLVNAIMELTA